MSLNGAHHTARYTTSIFPNKNTLLQMKKRIKLLLLRQFQKEMNHLTLQISSKTLLKKARNKFHSILR